MERDTVVEKFGGPDVPQPDPRGLRIVKPWAGSDLTIGSCEPLARMGAKYRNHADETVAMHPGRGLAGHGS